jgi:eukaryotic-like serine/threonine-protein kinase
VSLATGSDPPSIRGRVHPGAIIDGYRVGECIHKGGTGSIYRATALPQKDPGFPIVIKAPLLGRGESSIGIDSFEMEQTVLPNLTGRHVPRFVAAGDVTATPYIVMEWIDGQGLSEFVARAPLPPEEVARIGAALADALQSVHAQEVIHLDVKPENFILRPTGEAVLLDFGFARHARYPDLLAEEQQFAAGSAAYVSPEQMQDDRSDARSDLFALGVVLHELATGRQPFGQPETLAGMRDRLWRQPPPPRAVNDCVPPWLQEIILRCLEHDAAARYPSAAHVALDLRHPELVALSVRSQHTTGTGFFEHLAHWWRARRKQRIGHTRERDAPPGPVVIMVAVDTEHPDDERHSPLRWTTGQIASLNPELRLMCVSVVKSPPVGEGDNDSATTTGKHLEHKTRLRHWVEPLKLPASRVSLHVVQAVNAADTLLDLARANHVGLIVLGAPGPSAKKLGWWRSAASTITANAPCSVHVVRVPERRMPRRSNVT